MAHAYLPLVLRITKGLTGVFLVMAAVLTLSLCGKMVNVASEPEVRLALDTSRPNMFEAWHETQAGFQDGLKGQHRPERGPLPTLATAPAAGFAVQASPYAQVLRYREPSDAKRMALQAIGALDDSLSVAGLLFLGYGSWLLLRLLQDVTPEMPFDQANARRLRKLALLVLGLNLWHYVAYLLVWVLVPAYRVAGLAYPLSHYVRLNTDGLVPGLAVGFVLVIIAAVYQRGVELSREAELVI
jgi:hypothetical protein